MKVLYLSEINLPSNTAYANRVLALLRGVVEAGSECDVAVFKVSMAQPLINDYYGVRIKNIGMVKVGKIFPYKIFQKFDAFLSMMLYLSKRTVLCDIIIFSTENNFLNLLILLIAKFKQTPLLYLKSELPEAFDRNELYLRLFYKIASFFDGIVLITDKLMSHFTEKTGTCCTKIGMVVEMDRFIGFSKNVTTKNESKYIFFMGSIINEKDGISSMLKVFIAIKDRHPELKLKIVSSSGQGPILYNENIAGRDDIEVLINIDRHEVLNLMVNASILCLPRPRSLQNDYGFPTKLGEYLCAGSPIILSATSEIPELLTHMEDCYIFEPGDEIDFQNGLELLLENENLRLRLANNARKTVSNLFSHTVQGYLLNGFIDKIVRRSQQHG